MSHFYHREEKRNLNGSARKISRKELRLESLEDRLLLTAVPNGWGTLADPVNGVIGPSGTSSMRIHVESPNSAALIGLLVSPDLSVEGNELDPGAISLYDASGQDVTASSVLRNPTNYQGKSSLALLSLSSGDYRIVVNSENNSTGAFVCDVFLPGDTNRDGKVDSLECGWTSIYASATDAYHSGVYTQGVIQFYQRCYGIDITDGRSVYNASYDVNMDGVVDASDVTWMKRNLGQVVVSIDHSVEVAPWVDQIEGEEGGIGISGKELAQTNYEAEIDEAIFVSESFSITRFVQTGAVSSRSGAVDRDFSPFLSFNEEDGRFVFNAEGDVFDPLQEGETLTLSFEFYLDDLVFTGSPEQFDNVKGGTLTVIVVGKNDAPVGGSDFSTGYDLSTGTLDGSVNVMTDVTDPDGDSLTPTLVRAALLANRFGIPTDVDYSGYFSISETGALSVDPSIADLLTPVPVNETVVFQIDYQVTDPSGSSVGGTVTLTVTGQNEAPTGASDLVATYDLATGGWSDPVNVMADVTDPDGDPLTPTLVSSTLNENDYGIPTDVDYSDYFSISETGVLSASDSLSELLTVVPAGSEVTFRIVYRVSDPSDEVTSGTVTLTVAGKNEAPTATLNPLVKTESISADNELIFSFPVLTNLSDVDIGDDLSLVSVVFGQEYSAEELVEGVTTEDWTLRYDVESGFLTIAATPEKVESLRWSYNATDDVTLLSTFQYRFTDGIALESADGAFYFDPADDALRILSQPADQDIFQNSGATETDRSSLGTTEFLADRDRYSVVVIVTDEAGTIIHFDGAPDLVTATIDSHPSGIGGTVDFVINDYLLKDLDANATYSVRYLLQYEGVTEAEGGFHFTVRPIEVSQWSGPIEVNEGETGWATEELSPTSFTATINGETYRSESFVITRLTQTGAVSSLSGEMTGDYAEFVTFLDSGFFTFDATSSRFISLREGETLTLTFDFYLDDLCLVDYPETFGNVKGGTLTVVVTGQNDAPTGGSNYVAGYDLATASLDASINVTDGVCDPEGDSLTPSLLWVDVMANRYGLAVDRDYSGYFSISPSGDFSVNENLADLLTVVPADETVVFRAAYQVADPFGAATDGVITLTVTGQNDAPVGGTNYVAGYDLATASLDALINVTGNVNDPDDDPLTPSILSATLQANDYGISTEVDYSDHFSVTQTGEFSVLPSLTPLLRAIPANGTVVFQIAYQVADPFGESTGGMITLTVTGENDAPTGGSNYLSAYDLATETLEPTFNLMAGVTDVDNDLLTSSIDYAVLMANPYGIATDVNYVDYFHVSEGGEFSIDDSLKSLLAPVPANGTVTFQIVYQVSDPFGAETGGTITLKVTGQNEAPTGGSDFVANYSLATRVLSPTVNLLDGVSDIDGDPLTPSIESATLRANDFGIPTDVDYSDYFALSSDGNFSVRESLTTLLAFVPRGETVTFDIVNHVSDPFGGWDARSITLTVTGDYEAPEFNGVAIADVTGSLSGTVSIDLSDYFTGSISDYQLVWDGDSAILDSETPYSLSGSILTFHFLDSEDYASDLNLSSMDVTVVASDGNGLTASSNAFTVSLAEEWTAKISLVAVTTSLDDEVDSGVVKTLKTGASRFGTFYYAEGDAIPATDYEAIAQADEYSLEIWVQDLSYFIHHKAQLLTSIQVQLNYRWDGSGIESIEMEDLYAGKTALDNYLYYDEAERYLKAIQVTWLFSDSLDWSLVSPITNGENAFLLARMTVTANSAASIELDAALSGVDEPVSPFVGGWYYVRTGETSVLDASQIKTSDIKASAISSVTGAAGAEYVVDGGAYIRAVTEKTATDEWGRVEKIGLNADYLHEWQTHYAEIWVKLSEAEKFSAVTVAPSFDSDYFTVQGVEFGSAWSENEVEYDAENGNLVRLTVSSPDGITGDGYVLIARVTLQSANDAGVAWTDSLIPLSLGWGLSSASVVTTTGLTRASYLGKEVTTELWANPYDVNDDGVIDVADFVAFAAEYGHPSIDHFVGMCYDFNRDGTIDVQDFVAFSGFYGITRKGVMSGEKSIAFPDSFTQRYVGTTIDADNAAMVGKILDAANQAWTDALGLESPLSVTIIVKDFGNEELALAQTVETDASGLTTRGIIYLDDDAGGNLWFSQWVTPIAGSERYDLYSVLLHELGHLYGYDANLPFFTDAIVGFDYVVGDHSTRESDVMFPTIDPGVRKSLTEADVEVVRAVRERASREGETEGTNGADVISLISACALPTGSGRVSEEFAMSLLPESEADIPEFFLDRSVASAGIFVKNATVVDSDAILAARNQVMAEIVLDDPLDVEDPDFDLSLALENGSESDDQRFDLSSEWGIDLSSF